MIRTEKLRTMIPSEAGWQTHMIGRQTNVSVSDADPMSLPRCGITAEELMKQSAQYDLFVDLTENGVSQSEVEKFLRLLESEEGHFGSERRITLAMPSDRSSLVVSVREWATCFTDKLAALSSALELANSENRALAVVIGAWRYSNIFTCSLVEQSDCDPMIGTLQPRFSGDDGRTIYGITSGATEINSAALSYLPPHYITTEILSVMFLITPQGVSAAPKIGGHQGDIYGELLGGLRRRGFRNLICNGIVISPGIPSEKVFPPLKQLFKSDFPADSKRPIEWLESMPERRLESALSSAFDADARPRLLLDCRGLQPVYNGTSVCVLGFLKGIRQALGRGFSVSVWVSPEAAEFHNLRQKFGEFKLIVGEPSERFFAAILLNQPWSIDAIRELNELSCLIMFNMLDTIAWDIGYCAPAGLDSTWRVLGKTADAIFFNSDYTRNRYTFRFAPDPQIPLVVTHHSTSRDEINVREHVSLSGGAPFLFVMGNDYDHKAIAPTLSVLSDAFPYTTIYVVGTDRFLAENVIGMRSGDIPEERLFELFSGATAIVFPSYYEGFGLPVVEALALRKPVIVRESTLWDEIAEITQNSNLMMTYRTDVELVEAVGQVLHGSPPSHNNRAVVSSEVTWMQCADRMLETAWQLVASFDGQRWLTRQIILGR